MNFKLITIACLFSVFIFSTWCASNEAQLKHPPKPKPQPEELSLPAPFDQWDECDLLSKVYSEYNCETGIVRKKNNKAQSEAEDEIADVSKVSLWNANGTTQLLVLIEISFAQWHDNASGGKSADLALFDVISRKLNLAAFSETVAGYRQFGRSKLDLAPYTLNSTERAIGLRWSPGINGVGEEYLDLYRLKNGKFHQIFSREMWFEDGLSGRNSILKIIQKSSGMNDLLLITTTYKLNDNGDKERGSSKKTTETWRWNEQTQTYQQVVK